jgi:K+-transporting ATPase ATPase B chain
MPTQAQTSPLFDSQIVRRALGDSVRKLDPRQQIKNPVMCVVAVGALLTTAIVGRDLAAGPRDALWFNAQIMVWLPATSSQATERWSPASPAWTSRRSPENPRR